MTQPGAAGERRRRAGDEAGYAMAALLMAIAVMGVMLTVLLPAWTHAARREKEAELVFRGQQYARAIALFQRRFAGAFPPSIDVLVEQRFLRERYLDPMTGGEFQPVFQTAAATTPGAIGVNVSGGTAPSGETDSPGRDGAPPAEPPPGSTSPIGPTAGIMGVVSRSTEESIRLYNGRDHYNQWVFDYTQVAGAAGAGQPAQTPGGAAGASVPGGFMTGPPTGGSPSQPRR